MKLCEYSEQPVIVLVLAMMSVVITVFQEARTERVLESLRNLASPRALVIRDGVGAAFQRGW